MNDEIKELKIRLRDAELAKIKEAHKDTINTYGQCPYHYSHFDPISFAVGFGIGSGIAIMIIDIAGNLK